MCTCCTQPLSTAVIGSTSQSSFPKQMDSARCAAAFDARSPEADSSIDAKEAEDRKTSEDEIIKHWLSNQSLQDLERELAAAEQALAEEEQEEGEVDDREALELDEEEAALAAEEAALAEEEAALLAEEEARLAEEEAALASREQSVAAGDIGDTDELGSAGDQGEEDGESYPYDDGDDDEDIEAELEALDREEAAFAAQLAAEEKELQEKLALLRQSFAARGPPAVSASASAPSKEASDVVVGQRTVLRSRWIWLSALLLLLVAIALPTMLQPQTGQHSWGYSLLSMHAPQGSASGSRGSGYADQPSEAHLHEASDQHQGPTGAEAEATATTKDL